MLSNEEIKSINKKLCEEFPFLLPRNVWTDKLDEDYAYEYTWLDQMPQGWRDNFSIDMCKEIKEALIRADCLDKYRISQIKEKYGELRWYDFGAPTTVHDIVHKYARLSHYICINCGKNADYVTLDWISPFCKDCIGESISHCEEVTKYWVSEVDLP